MNGVRLDATPLACAPPSFRNLIVALLGLKPTGAGDEVRRNKFSPSANGRGRTAPYLSQFQKSISQVTPENKKFSDNQRIGHSELFRERLSAPAASDY
jgi:hypothetical protein